MFHHAEHCSVAAEASRLRLRKCWAGPGQDLRKGGCMVLFRSSVLFILVLYSSQGIVLLT